MLPSAAELFATISSKLAACEQRVQIVEGLAWFDEIVEVLAEGIWVSSIAASAAVSGWKQVQ